MASIMRIKRSAVTGNPATLGTGELAYSNADYTSVAGGGRLYVGMGTETDGNAVEHVVIGGKYFTDKLDHSPGTLTASSALIVDADSKLDNLLVDNLQLNGNTVSSTGDLILSSMSGVVLNNSEFIAGGSYGGNRLYLPTGGGATLQSGYEGGVTLRASTNNTDWVTVNLSTSGTLSIPGEIISGGTNANITITPNGSGKTVISNLYIGDTSTPLSEYIYDTVGGALTAGSGIDVTNSDGGNTSTISLNTEYVQDLIGLMVTSNVQSGISVTYDDLNGKLDFNVNDPTITITGDVDGSATMTNLGNTTIDVTLDTLLDGSTGKVPGSYGTSTAIPAITVDAKGRITAVTTNSISTSFTLAADTGAPDLFNTGSTLTFTGGEGIDTSVTDNTITISSEIATSSNLGVASFNTSGFIVTAGDVALKGNVVQSITTDTGALIPSTNGIAIVGGEGVNVTHSGTTITVEGELASTTNAGVASFNSDSFSVTDGVVSVKAGGITNNQLANSSVTIGSTSIALGATSTTLAGLTEFTVDNININGNEIQTTGINQDISLNPSGTGTVAVNGARISGVGAPTADSDAATKIYVDNKITGLTWKAAVNLYAAANFPLTGTWASIAAGIDGHLLDTTDVGYRFLLANQTTNVDRGVYTLTDVDGTDYLLVRSDDADTYQELIGSSVFIMEGDNYADTGWVQGNHYLTSFADQAWVQFSGAGTYTAGAGLQLDGTTFNVLTSSTGGIQIVGDNLELNPLTAGDGLTYTTGVFAVGGTADRISITSNAVDIASTYVGQSSITTLGTVTTGTWSADTILATKGGTGISTYAVGDTLYASATNTLSKLAKPAAETSLLTMNTSGEPTWTVLSNTGITGLGTVTTGTWSATTIATTKGGTGLTSYTTGDLVYASSTNTLAKLAAGVEGKVLQINASGVPVWGDIDGGTY